MHRPFQSERSASACATCRASAATGACGLENFPTDRNLLSKEANGQFFFLTGYGCPDRWEAVRWRVCKDGVVNREGDSAYAWVNHEPSGGTNLTAAEGGRAKWAFACLGWRWWYRRESLVRYRLSCCVRCICTCMHGRMDGIHSGTRQSGTRRELVVLIWFVPWTITLHILYRYDGYAFPALMLQTDSPDTRSRGSQPLVEVRRTSPDLRGPTAY